jgi:hypothetical protein
LLAIHGDNNNKRHIGSLLTPSAYWGKPLSAASSTVILAPSVGTIFSPRGFHHGDRSFSGFHPNALAPAFLAGAFLWLDASRICTHSMGAMNASFALDPAKITAINLGGEHTCPCGRAGMPTPIATWAAPPPPKGFTPRQAMF